MLVPKHSVLVLGMGSEHANSAGSPPQFSRREPFWHSARRCPALPGGARSEPVPLRPRHVWTLPKFKGIRKLSTKMLAKAWHHCDMQQSSCKCLSMTDGIHRMTESLSAVLGPMFPSVTPAFNRWQSVSPFLALLTLLILLSDIGPAGWLQQWPLERAHRDVLVNDSAGPDDPLRLQQSKRILSVCRNMVSDDWKILVTFSCVCTLPIDKLLRYLMKHEATENRHERSHPLLFDLVGERANPVSVAARDIARLLEADSDAAWLVRFWECRKGYSGEQADAFRTTWRLNMLRLVVHQALSDWRVAPRKCPGER